MNERPVARPALRILFRLRGVIERELDVVKGLQLAVFEKSYAVAVRCDSKLNGLGAQVREDWPQIRIDALLAVAEVHGTNGQAPHDGPHLIERETVRRSRISVAKGAREIALVG